MVSHVLFETLQQQLACLLGLLEVLVHLRILFSIYTTCRCRGNLTLIDRNLSRKDLSFASMMTALLALVYLWEGQPPCWSQGFRKCRRDIDGIVGIDKPVDSIPG